MAEFIQASLLLFILLNPFLMVVYLLDVFEKLPPETFRFLAMFLRFPSLLCCSVPFLALLFSGWTFAQREKS